MARLKVSIVFDSGARIGPGKIKLLQSVRDEAHRFAQHYHHMLRRKKLTGDAKKKRGRRRPPPRVDPADPDS